LGSFRTIRLHIGFVLHNRPTPVGPRATRPRRRIGFVLRKSSPPRHGAHAGATGASPAVRWGFSLGCRCLCGQLIVSCRRPRRGPSQANGAPPGSPFTPFSPSHFSNSRLRRLPQPPPPLLIDVCPAPYVVQEPKNRQRFLHLLRNRMFPFRPRSCAARENNVRFL
jgi:hypothetical protein